MKKILSFLTIVLTVTGAYAQRIPSKIELKDNTTVTFVKEEVDSTRELPNVGIKVYPKESKVSQDFLYSQISNIEFYEGTGLDRNENRNTVEGGHLLEYPHFKEGSDQLIIVKSTDAYGVTFTIEWDCSKKSQRWTAYEFHDGIPDNKVGRTGSFQDDPDIPTEYQSHESWYKNTGYDKGHICMSNDRQASTEQNGQTFYMSNIMPQYSAFNQGGGWSKLEDLISDRGKSYRWGYNTSMRDTLYVVKGGTIRDDQILETLDNGLVVPKYFFMALLCVKDDSYEAIAFLTEHVKAAGTYSIMSVDQLEEFTGIDFFCNLPDDIEEEVESKYDQDYWPGL